MHCLHASPLCGNSNKREPQQPADAATAAIAHRCACTVVYAPPSGIGIDLTALICLMLLLLDGAPANDYLLGGGERAADGDGGASLSSRAGQGHVHSGNYETNERRRDGRRETMN